LANSTRQAKHICNAVPTEGTIYQVPVADFPSIVGSA